MPITVNPTVTVTYENGKFTFAPDGGDVTMQSAGNITFIRGGTDPTWKFSDFYTDPSSAQFSIVGSLPSTTLVIQDADTASGTFEYYIELDNGAVCDPQIVNVQE